MSDPFAVSGSIAHFELLNARALALLPEGTPPPLRAPLAYWSALRGMMRIELEECLQVTYSGPTVPTVGSIEAMHRPPGHTLGPSLLLSPTQARRVHLGRLASPGGPSPSG